MPTYGLIGYPLGHSFSKRYFDQKFEREAIEAADFQVFPLENIADFPSLIAAVPDLRGLSVTIPHKETVMPLLDEVDPLAREVGAVNCIRIRAGKLTGFNTDIWGFEQSLRSLDHGKWVGPGQSALILGTGGAAKAVAWCFRHCRIPYLYVSRTPANDEEISYAAIDENLMRQTSIVVNTTPLGTFPHVAQMPPFPVELFGPKHLAFDLIYNPAETLFLQRAAQYGSATQNGMDMLTLQAEKAWEIWNNEN